jgi:rRNA maturation endonuclease Nob1
VVVDKLNNMWQCHAGKKIFKTIIKKGAICKSKGKRSGKRKEKNRFTQ